MNLETIPLKARQSDGVPVEWEGLSFLCLKGMFYLAPTARELMAMPTIGTGHFYDLKIDRDGLRYLVTRSGWADGEKFKVTIETSQARPSGKDWWTTLYQYEDIRPGEELVNGEWTCGVSEIVTCNRCGSRIPECDARGGRCFDRCA